MVGRNKEHTSIARQANWNAYRLVQAWIYLIGEEFTIFVAKDDMRQESILQTYRTIKRRVARQMTPIELGPLFTKRTDFLPQYLV